VLYGLLGLSLSGAVHFGTYMGASIGPSNPLFFALHIGVFPLFGVFLWRILRWKGKRRLFGESEPSHWNELLRYFPIWIVPMALVLFVYTGLNFFLAIGHLRSHASILTPSEALYTARAFSGHWLFFYTIPTLYLGFVPSDAYPSARGVAPKAAV
jgi:hypothetical protein